MEPVYRNVVVAWGAVVAIAIGLAWLMTRGVPTP